MFPPLINSGSAHAPFEIMHWFLDGNRRVGRLLIMILPVHRGVLHRPLLYRSHDLKRRRDDSYERQAAGDPGAWRPGHGFRTGHVGMSRGPRVMGPITSGLPPATLTRAGGRSSCFGAR
jgi:hypothetical protein